MNCYSVSTSLIAPHRLNTMLLSLAALAAIPLASGRRGLGKEAGTKPITLDRSGGFAVGGTTITDPKNATRHLSCDHGYMEYFIPWNPRKTSLVMWHSSSTQVFQNRWDGGPGFKDIFLRSDYPVYLWDGPRVGRANWACVPISYQPEYRDEDNFWGWNFGEAYPDFWPGVQFPTADHDAWHQAIRARYDEFDNWENVVLHARSAASAADSGKVGDSIVYVTNSAGGFRAQMTAALSNTTHIRGIVAYESIGFVYPEGANVTADTVGPFGPAVVPSEQFKKLAGLSVVQFIWGDHRARDNFYVLQSQKCADYINLYGGNAEVLFLPDAGLNGNTHIAMADMNNHDVAGLVERLLKKHGLDGYEDSEDE